MRSFVSLSLAAAILTARLALAHDTWVEVNTNLVKPGEVVDVDLKLGNHGNEHRDFKLNSKVTLDWVDLAVVAPSGVRHDLKPLMKDMGFGPKEGYWSGGFVAKEPGLHTVVQTLDRVMKHGKSVRGVRVAKTYFLASPSLDQPSFHESVAPSKPMGLPFELVLESCPICREGASGAINVRLYKSGKPLPNTTISFIPRGVELAPGFDERHERKTDADGRASYVNADGGVLLIVAHHAAPDEKTAEYEMTHYAATVVVRVPRNRLASH